MTKKEVIIPPRLEPSDTIGIMAPSTLVNKDKLEQAAFKLQEKGYKTFIHPQCYEAEGSSAGTPSQKAEALHELIENPEIKMILTAAGGNHSGMLLKHIDYSLIKNNPKIICGYSDVTALLCAIQNKTSLITYHGPTASHLIRDKYSDDQFDQLIHMLSGTSKNIDLNHGSTPVKNGDSFGHLIGGNLSLISSIVGTPYAPEFKGSILFLEDCADQLSRYARMITQLYNAGIFEQINGLIIGDMSAEKDNGSVPFGSSAREIIEQLTRGHEYPVIINAPFGHATHLLTFPVGQNVTLKVDDQNIQIKL